jgi:hypothetical protein
MPSSEPALELILSAAYTAYVDGRAADAAVLFGARLARGPAIRPTLFRLRPVLEALEKQGLREQIAAGANVRADDALKRVIALVSPLPSAPA